MIAAMLRIVILSAKVVKLNIVILTSNYAECHYDNCSNAEDCYTDVIMKVVAMLSFVILSAVIMTGYADLSLS